METLTLLRPAELLIILILLAAIITPWAYIFKKAGLPVGLCLFMWIPIVGWIILLIFAFTPWPSLKKKEKKIEIKKKHKKHKV